MKVHTLATGLKRARAGVSSGFSFWKSISTSSYLEINQIIALY